MAPPRILISNDDGINAQGLLSLAKAIEPLGEVWIVAPEAEQSAASHALSLHRPLRVKKLGDRRYAIDGTPADCVYMGVNHLMKDGRPSLVLSGINHGPNMADDVIYSGTVAAAMEGALLGVPAIAFSLASRRSFDFEAAANFAASLSTAVLAATELPRRMLLNVNIPAPPTELHSYEVTRLGRHSYGSDVIEKDDPRGRKYYWIGGTGYEHEPEHGTDVSAVYDHHVVSVTPIMLDLTEHSLLDPVKRWSLSGFTRLD